MNAIYFQSGGPTAVINSSFYGVIKAFKEQNMVEKLYGSRFGIEGIINDDLVLIDKDLKSYEFLKQISGAILGTSRVRLKKDYTNDNNYEKIRNTVIKENIGYILVNGGNDSMDTANCLNIYFKDNKIDCTVVGIPKTIDNDLVETDHAPGFGSAAKYITKQMMNIYLDVSSYKIGRVTIVETMGRDAGWLAASSACASLFGMGPDLIYVPEVPFDSKKFLTDVYHVYNEKHMALVCVAEALKDENGEYISAGRTKDAFGHVQLGSVSKYLCDMISNNLGINTRNIELNLPQRASCELISELDQEEAINCGYAAFNFCVNKREGMVSIIVDCINPYKYHLELAHLKDVANGVKPFPIEYVTDKQNYINENFINFTRNFIDEDKIKIDISLLKK